METPDSHAEAIYSDGNLAQIYKRVRISFDKFVHSLQQ